MTVLKISNRPSKIRIPRPFLKWVGGKTQLLPVLTATTPEFKGTYHEPFIGGGAMFFELSVEHAHISDANQELIDCYETVRDHPELLVEKLRKFEFNKSFYYTMRAKNPSQMDKINRAARTIYLNKTGFNGLYRVNSKGIFNVPIGRYKNPLICDEPNLLGCSKALKKATIECRSFETVLERAEAGDFVYFDPPYIPVSDTAYFTAYEKKGFGMDNQAKLAAVFERLTEKKVFAMLSNSFVPWIAKRYAAFEIQKVAAVRSINSNATKRGEVLEVVITNYKNDKIIR